MIGVSGSLISHDALERVIPVALGGRLGETSRGDALKRLRTWHRPLQARLGPALSARGVFDLVGGPLTGQLGYRAMPLSSPALYYKVLLEAGGVAAAVLLVTAWGQDLASTWREAVRHGIGCGVRWCLCLSGPVLRLADSQRTYSRRFLEFELQHVVDREATFAALWGLLRAAALAGGPGGARPLLDEAVDVSERHRVVVRDSLQHGVEEALTVLARAFEAARPRSRARARPHAESHSPAADPRSASSVEEALIVIYRILFLLFAEARGLVPHWHPVFRASYTIESLRADVEARARPRGLWEALQAISRLAHRGCRTGTLRVPPFNGRLFSPSQAPLADALPLDDGAVRQAVLALTTRPARSGRERIAYGDLGVEQLGGVYERLLDFALPDPAAPPAPATNLRRKASGSFYTPRSLTEYLVRRTLAPLVSERSAAQILGVRVLDPAMGSGAFLVAACRYLAGAYELALLRDGEAGTGDLGDADRAGFRRLVAQRCLYGVDRNPTAVQLGRLSLWLATLAADRPLTFLDHRLRTGDSLIGASPHDVLRQPPPGRGPRRRAGPLPLFDDGALGGSIGSAIAVRHTLAHEPGDTLDQVRAKERALAALEHEESALTRWKRVADLWCSGWFRDDSSRSAFRVAFQALVDGILSARSPLPDAVATPLLDEARAIAGAQRFFHWALEFPEMFHDADGAPLPNPGFDAVIGNPPWEMLRGDLGDAHVRSDARFAAARISDFVRGAGIYGHQGDGHVNLYQLFVERGLSLLRTDGRLGLILPSGFATDHGCGRLRRALLNRALVDTFHGFENREGLFPIHRSLKFLLLTATPGAPTVVIPGRFGLRRADILEAMPDLGADAQAVPLSRAFLERASGEQVVIPDIRTRTDLEIVSAIVFAAPALAHPDGWRVSFGRELNATDDRRHFRDSGPGVPVIDGKHLNPFVADASEARFRIPVHAADSLARGAHRRPRLAYRDVTSATNRRTLIAAIVPAGVLTTHTVFCLKEPLDAESQLFLCGMFNSFVANYLVRLQVGTHVAASLIARLPMPKPARTAGLFRAIVASTEALSAEPDDLLAAARLQACAARLYGLTDRQLAHVLETFPLVSRAERDAVLAEARRMDV